MESTLEGSLLNKNIFNLESYLNEHYPQQKTLKVLKNMGESSCLIKLLQFNEYDLNGTIQIPGKYLKTMHSHPKMLRN